MACDRHHWLRGEQAQLWHFNAISEDGNTDSKQDLHVNLKFLEFQMALPPACRG